MPPVIAILIIVVGYRWFVGGGGVFMDSLVVGGIMGSLVVGSVVFSGLKEVVYFVWHDAYVADSGGCGLEAQQVFAAVVAEQLFVGHGYHEV